MISETAFLISNLLIKKGIIRSHELPVYVYGFEIFISSLITFFIALLNGILLHCLTASLLYFGVFALLRSICGGYHADTYFKCNIIFLVVTEFTLFMYKQLPIGYIWEYHWICVLFSIIILTSTVGSTVNAYVPTITRTFTYDNATVTGALMAASNIAADTSATKNFSTLKVEIKKNGNVIAVGSSNNVHYINTNASHPGGTISSVHTAYKNNTDYGTCTIVA